MDDQSLRDAADDGDAVLEEKVVVEVSHSDAYWRFLHLISLCIGQVGSLGPAQGLVPGKEGIADCLLRIWDSDPDYAVVVDP